MLSESVLFNKHAVSDVWLISSLVLSKGTRTAAVEVLVRSSAEVEEFAKSAPFTENALVALRVSRNRLVRSAPDIGVPVRVP